MSEGGDGDRREIRSTTHSTSLLAFASQITRGVFRSCSLGSFLVAVCTNARAVRLYYLAFRMGLEPLLWNLHCHRHDGVRGVFKRRTGYQIHLTCRAWRQG